MITEDPRFYLPNLYTFQNGNAFYGSFRGMRFFIEPNEQEGERVFTGQIWLGERCLEESTVVAQADFPLDESGYNALLHWLDGQYHATRGAAPPAPDGNS